jgi:tricorn protease interacting factor F2/3
MAYKAVDHFFPEWRMWEEFIRDETEGAFDEDSIKSTHPIEVEVRNPHELEEIFDAISYNKGGSVLRMLEDYVGREKFRQGVGKYLSEHEYGNATAADLWKALENVTEKPIRKVASAWTSLPGYPLVTAARAGNKIILSQKRFVFNASDKAVWPIPLAIMADGGRRNELLTQKKQIAAGWVKINYGQAGFYRVKYRKGDLVKLGGLAREKKLPPVDRWGLQSDLFRLCKHGDATISDYLDFLKNYAQEDSYLVLSSIAGSLRNIHFVFSQDGFWPGIWPQFREMFRGTFSSVLKNLGWEPDDGEPEEDALMRALAISFLGFIEEKNATKAALEKFRPDLHPNIRGPVFYIAAKEGNFQKLLDIYENSQSPEERRQVLAALGNLRDPAAIVKALDFSISDKVRRQDLPVTFSSASSNPASRSVLIGWVSRNWQQLEQYKKSHRLFIHIIEALITAYATREKEAELKRFFRSHPVEYRMTLDRSFDRLERNIAWRENSAKALEKYFS